MQIRNEQPSDQDAITEITISAFKTLAVSDHTEQFIIKALRQAGALTISLVAEQAGILIGHIAFSPVQISDGARGWYALGPVSVLPNYQRQGVGTALIQTGLSRLRGLDAQGCCLVGHPEYYPKFGFRNPSGLSVAGIPPQVFFALSFGSNLPQGEIHFHPAFDTKSDPLPPPK